MWLWNGSSTVKRTGCFSRRPGIWFPALTWYLIIISDSSSRGPNTLFWAPWVRHAHGRTYIHVGKTPTPKIINYKSVHVHMSEYVRSVLMEAMSLELGLQPAMGAWRGLMSSATTVHACNCWAFSPALHSIVLRPCSGINLVLGGVRKIKSLLLLEYQNYLEFWTIHFIST